MAKDFTPPKIKIESSLTVLPNLLIKINHKPLTTEEELFLQNFAHKESENVWQISKELAIKSLENGQNIETLREFLEARDEQGLPEQAEGFLRDIPKRATALKNKGSAQIIECQNAEIAEEIANNPNTKKLCLRAGTKSLVVLDENYKQFREIVRKIGYGVKFE